MFIYMYVHKHVQSMWHFQMYRYIYTMVQTWTWTLTCMKYVKIYMLTYISVYILNTNMNLNMYKVWDHVHFHHSWAPSVMDRYRWYQSIPMVPIITHGLILIKVIDPSVKVFFYIWSIVSTIDHTNIIWPMAINPSVHTQSIIWCIDQTYNF